MKFDLFLENLTPNQVYTFVSLQEDYSMTTKEAFDILRELVKSKLVTESEGVFRVVADEEKVNMFKETVDLLPEFKLFFKVRDLNEDENDEENDEENEGEDSKKDNSNTLKSSIWERFFGNGGRDSDGTEGKDTKRTLTWEDFDEEYEEDYFYDIDEGETKFFDGVAEDLKELEEGGYFLPMRENVTMYVEVQAYDDPGKKMKIDIRHSIEHFLENIEKQEPNLLKAFFVCDLDYKLFLADKNHLDLENSTFIFGDSLITLCDIDFEKPITDQRYVYSSIVSDRVQGESHYIFIKLLCKRN